MAEQDMRLRLVVRRYGLPEIRLMWSLRLDSDPTIAKVLEQLNNDVPLESDQWGLEDYVVELHDSDGTEFECLHYQSVRSVLKPDDRVFIRALERDDHRRRRISGRHQISSDGRHLIDGVPFGRPRLRAASDRPPVRIPPRKRARITYTQHDDDLNHSPMMDNDSSILLLTNGGAHNNGHTSFPIENTASSMQTDSDTDDADYTDDAEISSGSDESPSEEEGEEEDDLEDNELMKDDAREEGAEKDLNQEARDLAIDNDALEEKNPHGRDETNLSDTDKVYALRAAFPTAPVDICEKVLSASKGNLKTTYNVLAEGFIPQMSREAIIARDSRMRNRGAHHQQPRMLINPVSTPEIFSKPSTRKSRSRERSPGEDSNGEDNEVENDKHKVDLVKTYDSAGFPPGTITSGRGLTHMAAVSASFASSKMSGTSGTTSATLVATGEEPVEEDDSTSSSGSSSSSDGSGDESGSASEDLSSSAHSSGQPSSSGSDDSDSESADNSSQGRNGPVGNKGHRPSSPTSGSCTSDNGSDSDSGPEEHPVKVVCHSSPADVGGEQDDSNESSNDASDSGSTTTDSSSDSEEGVGDEPNDNEISAANTFASAQNVPHARPSSTNLAQTTTAHVPVPPGAGKESTKRRNARRRATRAAQREKQKLQAQDINSTGTERTPTGGRHTIDNEAALFEAKRKALLDAIATGGIEVGLSGETEIDRNPVETIHVKRKRIDEADTNLELHEDQVDNETTDEPVVENRLSSPTNVKRQRIDLGASRRLVFGALGLRNPKNKDDEDRLHNKLLSDAQLRPKGLLSARREPTAEQPSGVDKDEDLDAWRLKINYRAVECCHDNIELSPAPFPFQQRWDPQQQKSFSKRNKRGGQSKRAQRNQPHYYNDDSRLGMKRKRLNSIERMDNGYDDSFDRGDNDTNDGNVTLNYDDTESRHGDQDNEPGNGTSQTTDIDDLPSLPTDVSALPTLHPGQAQVGMVVSWQKWSCSSATSWQPQLSRVTAIVLGIDDDSAALDVCLAKRDRYLDGTEKRYDHRTGQRIYDKFEAPDLDEEDGDDNTGIDEGYRTVSWAEMQDPRILQQPLDTTAEMDTHSKYLDPTQIIPTSVSTEGLSEEPKAIAHSSRLNSPGPVPNTNEGSSSRDGIQQANVSLEGKLGDSSVKPCANALSTSTSHQAEHGQQATDMSMSDISQISSPSRQLHETTSQAMTSNSPTPNWAPTSSVERVESSPPHPSSSMPLRTTESSLPRLVEDFESDAIAGTPKVIQCQAVIPSSASSVHSGRQPDYAMDADEHVSDPFNATDDVDPQKDDDQLDSTPQARSSPTPVPSRRTATPDHGNRKGEVNNLGISPVAPPSSRSLSSLNSVWCTALTSHSTRSPSRIQSSSANMSQALRDLRYEEVMRKLDDDVIEESPSQATDSFEVKREDGSKAGSSSLRGKPASLQDISIQSQSRSWEAISPPPRRRASKPFSIPPGTQVFEISSDSEPMYTEDYADDDVDGTYSPREDSLPRGDGWVKKKGRDAKQRRARS